MTDELDHKALLRLYPEYTSVLGPYKRNDGRQHIVLNNAMLPAGTHGKLKTISYPKALKESIIGHRLKANETVDHHDRDFNNNNDTNLRIKDRSHHCSEDALRVRVDPVICPICNTPFIPNKDQRNAPITKAGPFCSKHCAGTYTNRVKCGAEKLNRTPLIKTYHKLDKTD